MIFSEHVLTPAAFAARAVELLPDYLPGMDTGAFAPTDRRRCWNKTLSAVLNIIGKDDNRLAVTTQNPMVTCLKDQSSSLWQRDGTPVFAMTTGWGERSELETCLEWLEAFKCPQKLFVYSCAKWQQAVLEQICAALLRYPYHIEGEQYLFMNLVGSENRFHLFTADLTQGGLQSSGYEKLLRPVPGSPFAWNARKVPHAS